VRDDSSTEERCEPHVSISPAMLRSSNMCETWKDGAPTNSTGRTLVGEALRAAGGADAVVAIVGLDVTQECEGNDRANVSMPGGQVHKDPCSCCLHKDRCSCCLHKDPGRPEQLHRLGLRRRRQEQRAVRGADHVRLGGRLGGHRGGP